MYILFFNRNIFPHNFFFCCQLRTFIIIDVSTKYFILLCYKYICISREKIKLFIVIRELTILYKSYIILRMIINYLGLNCLMFKEKIFESESRFIFFCKISNPRVLVSLMNKRKDNGNSVFVLLLLHAKNFYAQHKICSCWINYYIFFFY